MKYSVKKIYAGIGTIYIYVLIGFGAFKNPDVIPELLYPLSLLVLSLFGLKSASVVADKYIDKKGKNDIQD